MEHFLRFQFGLFFLVQPNKLFIILFKLKIITLYHVSVSNKERENRLTQTGLLINSGK